MSERSTQTIDTSAGPVVYYDQATGGDVMDLEMAAAEHGSIAGRGEMKLAIGKAYKDRLRKMSDLFIVSIGEKKDREEIFNALRGLSAQEYNLVMATIGRVADGLPAEEGKA